MCIIFPVLPPRPGLSLLSYPSSRLSRILVKVVMSLKLRVELESAFDLNEREMCDYGHIKKDESAKSATKMD